MNHKNLTIAQQQAIENLNTFADQIGEQHGETYEKFVSLVYNQVGQFAALSIVLGRLLEESNDETEEFVDNFMDAFVDGSHKITGLFISAAQLDQSKATEIFEGAKSTYENMLRVMGGAHEQ